MTTLSPALKKKKAHRATAPAKPEEEKKARKPAYLRRKMAVSQPQDREEREADQVAQKVARAPREEEPGPKENKEMISSRPAPGLQRLLRQLGQSVARQETQEEEETIQTRRLRRAAGKPEEKERQTPVRRSVETEEKKEGRQTPLARRLWRKADAAKPDEEQKLHARLLRAAATEEQAEQEQAREEEAAAGPETAAGAAEQLPTLEEQIEQSRGQGQALPENVLRDMERQFGQDLSRVVIHNDATAAAMCRQVNARAFTVGNDIYFAQGEYAPETEQGRELLAHELTHVVQQKGGIGRKIYRADGDEAAPENTFSVSSGEYAGASIRTDTGNKRLSLPWLRLPALKQRNSGLFPKPLPVRQESRPRTDQTANFRSAVNSAATSKLTDLTTEARNRGSVSSEPPAAGETFFFTLTNNPQFLLFGTSDTLLPRFEIPFWDRQGRPTNFQVDHIREMQLNGEDEAGNYELLEGDANMGAGRAIAAEIRDSIKGGLDALKTANPTAALPSSNSWGNVKRTYNVSFSDIRWNLPHDGSGNSSRFWALDTIQEGDHTALLRPMTASERTSFGVGGTPAVFASSQGGEPLPSVATPRPNWIPRVDLVSWSPSEEASDNLGTLVVSAFKSGSGVTTSPDYPNQSWVVKRIPGMNAGFVDPNSYTVGIRNSLRLPGMSAIELDEVRLSAGGIIGEGRVLPSIPLISAADIGIRISGNEAQVYKTFSMEELQLPAPLRMNSCDLTVFFSNTRGLGVDGRADFGIDRLGEGYLCASASTRGGFELEGGFDFDSRLFDEFSIVVRYRENRFSGGGRLAITSPNKIRGIRSASLTANFEEGAFSATGTVAPNIPGIQQAGLTVGYSEETGLTIGGNLQLAANPVIRSGSIDVTVNKRGEDWRVSASGTAQPAIPGVDSQLTVSYDDGAFTAEFSGSYRRGMLSGSVTVGATNRAVGEDGRPSGEAQPDAPLTVYGSGSATIQIAPWLQGTAGIRFAPNGEVTVSGEIGIPSNVEIFARRQIERSILNIAVQIPIIPGIVAEVGGGLTAVAGIGPGVIDQLRIGITYNPAHEEDTHVTGDAHLRVPADAGLRLSVRAGIGLGITGASATGGLEIGGTLGIEGAAEAGVHIDWTPGTGLDLTAELSVHAQPSFTFDISGYVSVRVLGFSVYDQRWQFASYTFGSDYRFGISLPIHYHEGEPFDISLDDVQFEVPDISPGDILSGLIERIA